MPTYIFGENSAATNPGSSKTTYIDTANTFKDTAYGASTRVYVRDDAMTASIWYTLLRFGLTAIAIGESIASATLRMFLSAEAGSIDKQVGLHAVTTNWGVSANDEGAAQNPATAQQPTAAASFAAIPFSTPWAGALFGAGDYNPVAADSVTVLNGAVAGTAYDFDLTALAQDWLAGVPPNLGIALVPLFSGIGEYVGFYGKGYSNPIYRPMLTVVTNAAPAPAAVDTARPLISIGVSCGIGF